MKSLADVASLGGIEPRGGRSWGPCPVCGAERRGRDERRGPLTFYGDRWKCYAAGCTAGGTAAALLAAIRFREIPPKGDAARWREVLVEVDGSLQPRTYRPATARFVRPDPDQGTRNGSNRGATEPPTYPPPDEVRAVWEGCDRLDRLPPEDAAVQYVVGRGLVPALLAQLDLARVLPDRWPTPAPRWIPSSAVRARSHRLVVPVYDARGEMRSLRFRAVSTHRAKSLPPAGFNVTGLVMADSLGRAILRGERADEDQMPFDGRVVICEGETDFWTVSARPTRIERARVQGQTFAAFGLVAGAWTPDVAARVPTAAQVLVCTDHDEAGDRYAEVVRASLSPRCSVLRRPSTPATSS